MPERDDVSPLDDLGVQLPGRIMALEIVTVLMMRQKANAGRLLHEADEILTILENREMKSNPPGARGYALNVFTAARLSLDKIAAEARRR